MVTLTFDTSTSATLVGLQLADGTVVERHEESQVAVRPVHTKVVLQCIQQLMHDQQLQLTDIKRLVVGVGPGTFTGLRVGLATALGLAAGWPHVEAVGVSTIASYHQRYRTKNAFALLQARREEVFLSGWSHEKCVIEPQLVHITDIERVMSKIVGTIDEPYFAYGHGAQEWSGRFEHLGVTVPVDPVAHHPSAQAFIELAQQEQFCEELQPHYFRGPDAIPPRRKDKAK